MNLVTHSALLACLLLTSTAHALKLQGYDVEETEYLEIPYAYVAYSITLQNMINDSYPSPAQIIHLPYIKQETLVNVMGCLSLIDSNNIDQLTNVMNQLTNEQLHNLMNAANCLDIPVLLTISSQQYAQRYFNNDVEIIKLNNTLLQELQNLCAQSSPIFYNVYQWLSRFINIQSITSEIHTIGITSIQLSHDGTKIVSGASDSSIKIWDITTGVCLQTLTGHTGYVYSVCLSHDGTKIVSCSNDSTIKIWDIKTGTCLQTLTGHIYSVNLVCLSHDDTKIISCSNDSSIKIWDITTGICLQTVTGHTGYVYSTCFSHDGTKIVSCSNDSSIKIWDVKTGICLQTLIGHTSYVYSACFSHDDTKIASCSNDSSIKIWDIKTGICLQTITGHTGHVYSTCFSHDDTKIVSCSNDSTLKIWNLDNLLNLVKKFSTITIKQLYLLNIIMLMANNNQQLDLNENDIFDPSEIYDTLPDVIKCLIQHFVGNIFLRNNFKLKQIPSNEKLCS